MADAPNPWSNRNQPESVERSNLALAEINLRSDLQRLVAVHDTSSHLSPARKAFIAAVSSELACQGILVAQEFPAAGEVLTTRGGEGVEATRCGLVLHNAAGAFVAPLPSGLIATSAPMIVLVEQPVEGADWGAKVRLSPNALGDIIERLGSEPEVDRFLFTEAQEAVEMFRIRAGLPVAAEVSSVVKGAESGQLLVNCSDGTSYELLTLLDGEGRLHTTAWSLDLGEALENSLAALRPDNCWPRSGAVIELETKIRDLCRRCGIAQSVGIVRPAEFRGDFRGMDITAGSSLVANVPCGPSHAVVLLASDLPPIELPCVSAVTLVEQRFADPLELCCTAVVSKTGFTLLRRSLLDHNGRVNHKSEVGTWISAWLKDSQQAYKATLSFEGRDPEQFVLEVRLGARRWSVSFSFNQIADDPDESGEIFCSGSIGVFSTPAFLPNKFGTLAIGIKSLPSL